MMNKMIVANLVHRPIRSLISIIAIALEVTLILLIVGLCYGMVNDCKDRTAGIGADVIVQPPGSTFLAGISGAPVSIKIANLLAKVPHVTAVSPVIWQVSTGGALEVIDGIDLKSFEAIGGPFRFVKGGPFQGPDDAIIDDYIARQRHYKVGDKMERSEEHTSELQSQSNIVCRLLLEKKKKKIIPPNNPCVAGKNIQVTHFLLDLAYHRLILIVS